MKVVPLLQNVVRFLWEARLKDNHEQEDVDCPGRRLADGSAGPRCGGDRHQPDVIHSAHVVRGHARLEAGDVEGACQDLDEAGKQGSPRAPVLRSFGPDFRLAGMLLDAGRRDAVLSYLSRCASFWKLKRIARWRSAIERGERPLMFRGFDQTEPKE